MTPTEVTNILRQLNAWQRGDGPLDYVPSGLINAIDAAIEMIEQQAARHMEELQAKVDAIASPWQPMETAPKDGWGVLVLLNGSDAPHCARWLCGTDDPHVTEATEGSGWHLMWDGSPVAAHDGPRYWMHCPSDPDA